MTRSYSKQSTPDSSLSTFCNSMATSESSHYHTNKSLENSTNSVTPRLQNYTQRTVACSILMCLSTSMSLACYYSSTTQENNTARDHHYREARVFHRQPSCLAFSPIHMHMCSPRLRMCPSSSPCPARAVKRVPRSILAPLYPCCLFYFLFLCLFVTISLLLRSVSRFFFARLASLDSGDSVPAVCPLLLSVTLFVFTSE